MAWTKVSNWRDLLGVHHSRPDPYLIWAALTDWDNYELRYAPPPLPHVPRPWCRWLCALRKPWRRKTLVRKPGARDQRFVMIELVPTPVAVRKFRTLAARPDSGIEIPADYPKTSRHLTARVTLKGLNALARHGTPLGDGVRRFDLCEAIIPARAPRVILNHPAGSSPLRPRLRGNVLLGVVDDGCPFAHALFSPVIASGQAAAEPSETTRFAALWDQNPLDDLSATQAAYGHESEGFGYGREIFREYAGKSGTQGLLRGFADVLAAHVQRGGGDEETLYDEVGVPSMRRHVVHGPHVSDVFAGPVRVRERVAEDRDTPPSFERSSDVAGDAARSDLVFVQLPRTGLQDSSGGWLDGHVFDAVNYIDRCRSSAAQPAVINVSYGNTMGPHDGSSILDAALGALVDARQGKLSVVMAAGNSFAARGHAEFAVPARGSTEEHFELTWRVPPGSEAPHMLQIWLPPNTTPEVLKTVTISISPPGAAGDIGAAGTDQVLVWPATGRPAAVMSFLSAPSRGEDSALAMIGLACTTGEGDATVAPHGDWRIKLSCDTVLKHVHAYIARNDRDLGAALRGRQSMFIDEVDEDQRYLRAPIDDAGKNPRDTELFGSARDRAWVKRRGTQNGISTGPGVIAVAGYNRALSDEPSDGSHAPYSSAGWQVAGDSRACTFAASRPSDESACLPGIRAAGSRSGATFRLVGTSVAAPQEARALVDVLGGGTPNTPNQSGRNQAEPDPELNGAAGRLRINHMPSTTA